MKIAYSLCEKLTRKQERGFEPKKLSLNYKILHHETIAKTLHNIFHDHTNKQVSLKHQIIAQYRQRKKHQLKL